MAMASTTISFRTDVETKAAASELFRDLGLDMSTAINMFLRQAITDNGIPFTPNRESSESIRARHEAVNRIGATFNSVDALMADLRPDLKTRPRSV